MEAPSAVGHFLSAVITASGGSSLSPRPSILTMLALVLFSSQLPASITNLEGSGTLSVNTSIGQPASSCICQHAQPIEFPPSLPDNPASGSVDCLTCMDPSGMTTVGAVHGEGGFSGNSQALTFTYHSTGAMNTDHRAVLDATDGIAAITFTVTGAPTVVHITASMTITATGGTAGQASGEGSIRL